MIELEEFNRRLALTLDQKIKWAIERYLEYIEVYGVDGVYSAFSGGKDSQVLRDIIERLHAGEMMQYLDNEYLFLYDKYIKGVPAPNSVFADTKLEFPELRAHVKKFQNVVWTKPTKMYKEVVAEYGFAVGSKKIAMMVTRLKGYLDKPSASNEATKNLYLHGIKRDGSKSNGSKLPKKWGKLLDAPFEVSGACCDYFKKQPFKNYEKVSKKHPIIGTTAEESANRKMSYLITGCNSFNGEPKSRPLSIWTEQDVWSYSVKFKIKFCEVYYDRMINGTLIKGEKRTGCVICMFGITEEKGENRIQRLAKTHPKLHQYFVYQTGIKEVLQYIGVKYKPDDEQIDMFK